MAKRILQNAIPVLLDHILQEYNIDGIEPIFTTSIPGVTYTYTPIDEGAINHSQIEIKVIHKDIDEGLEILNRINNALNINAQQKSIITGGIELRPVLSGGGELFSEGPQAWELSSIFIITWRCL